MATAGRTGPSPVDQTMDPEGTVHVERTAGLTLEYYHQHQPRRSVAQAGRASVSKTEGRGFESCRSCQFPFDFLGPRS